jgi:hypothetical protein
MSGVVYDVPDVVRLDGTLAPVPTYPAAADLIYYDIVDDSVLPVRRIAPVKVIKLQYCKNYTPMPDGLAGVVRETTPALAVKLSKEYSTLEATNALQTSNPDAVIISPKTNIVNESDAITESARRLVLSGTERKVYALKTFSAPFNMLLNQVITIDYPQYFDGGVAAVITRLIDVFDRDQCSLEVVK